MDSTPFLFADSVCHQLRLELFDQITQLSSGFWSAVGLVHQAKRRNLRFLCAVKGRTVEYRCSDVLNTFDRWASQVEVKDLDLKYDRIVSFENGEGYAETIEAPLDDFQRSIFPTVASLVANCHFGFAERREDFSASINSMRFVSMGGCEGQDTCHLIAPQLEYGTIESIFLRPGDVKPKPEELAELFERFVRSARFHHLSAPGPLPNDYELHALFLERALAGELKEEAKIKISNLGFDRRRLYALYPECRVQKTKKLFWRIPNSNLVVGDALYFISEDEVELEIVAEGAFNPARSREPVRKNVQRPRQLSASWFFGQIL